MGNSSIEGKNRGLSQSFCFMLLVNMTQNSEPGTGSGGTVLGMGI